jgi:uncharacterized protein YndB with AHSA1/START domain
MKADIDATVEYPHPPEAVWAALTSSEALAAWFMPNDFAAEVGRRLHLPHQAGPRLRRRRPLPGA